MDETRELTRFVVEGSYDGLPTDTISLAKDRLLDILGESLFASRAPWSKMVHDLVVERSGRDDCTLWGSTQRADAGGAALANGTCGHGFELDDHFVLGAVHPGAVVIPAALAAGEQVGANGRQLLAAIVLGYEVMNRVALGVGTRHMLLGHHTTATTGVFGSAAAAGWLWGLGHRELLNAFGIAGSLASGIQEFSQDPEGTMVKRLYGGRPAESGLVAAGLARRGFTGPATVLEGRYGFLRVYSDEPNPAALVEGLGSVFTIRSVVTKPYSACAALHTMVDAIVHLLGERGVDRLQAEDVTAVELGFPRKTCDQNMIFHPRSIMAAQYSAPFTGALALAGRGGDPSGYTEENLQDPQLESLMSKFQGSEDPEMQALYPAHRAARVRVTFADGTTGEASVRTPKGGLDNPFSTADLEKRFDTLAGTVLSAARCREVRAAISDLESFQDVRSFAQLLAS